MCSYVSCHRSTVAAVTLTMHLIMQIFLSVVHVCLITKISGMHIRTISNIFVQDPDVEGTA